MTSKKYLTSLLAVMVVLCGLYVFIKYGLGLRPYDDPPAVGDRIGAVTARLGPPHYDSRSSDSTSTDQEQYQLGYTDCIGTRYHLTVRNGVVHAIEYSSR